MLTCSDDVGSADDASPCTAVISDALWNRRFARNRNAIGFELRLPDQQCTIVGVGAASFVGHNAGYLPDLWLPLRPLSWQRLLGSQNAGLSDIGA